MVAKTEKRSNLIFGTKNSLRFLEDKGFILIKIAKAIANLTILVLPHGNLLILVDLKSSQSMVIHKMVILGELTAFWSNGKKWSISKF